MLSTSAFNSNLSCYVVGTTAAKMTNLIAAIDESSATFTTTAPVTVAELQVEVKSDSSAGADTIITALGSSATATAIVDADIATSFEVEASSSAYLNEADDSGAPGRTVPTVLTLLALALALVLA